MKVIKGVPPPKTLKVKIKEFLESTEPGDMVQMPYWEGVKFVNRMRGYFNKNFVDISIITKKSDCKQFLNIWRF